MIPRACGVAISLAGFSLSAPMAQAEGPARVAHEGTWSEDGILWETRWAATPGQRFDTLDYLEALPKGTRVLRTPGGEVEVEDGRIHGVELYGPAASGLITVWIPQEADGDALVVPLLAGPGVQRVTLDGMDFTPASQLGFEKHVRYWAPPGIAGDGRKDFERQARRDSWPKARPMDQAVYLRAEQRFARGGIPGRLRPEGQVSLVVQAFLATVLLGLLGFGAALYRGLERQARAERNRAYIDRHFAEPSADPEAG